MGKETVKGLRDQGKDVTLTDVAKSLFYDDSHKLYVAETAPARPMSDSTRPSIMWRDEKVPSLNIQRPAALKDIKRIDSQTAQQGGYVHIPEISVFRPNVVCLGYHNGVFFAELHQLNPGKQSYIWYIPLEGLTFDRDANRATGVKYNVIAQSEPAKGLVAVQVRKPMSRYKNTIHEVSMSTGLGPWMPLRFTA